jgi:KEOPS complex subunit Cgi121
MELVSGTATVADVTDFVGTLRAIGADHGSTVQAFDSRYVVDRAHVERAVALADRAIGRDAAIADDRAMEILCYAAGTRQIEVALEIGVAAAEPSVIVLVDGGEETAAAAAVRAEIDTGTDPLGEYDERRVREFYGIGDAELGATDAGIPALVRERVALLVVDR